MQQANNDGNLWNNPYINAARQNMSKEDLEKYEEIGKSMYSIDYENVGTNNLPEFMKESALHIFESLKSGLHPSILDDDEKNILVEAFGVKWYEIFKYKVEDLTDIVTLEPDFNVSFDESLRR